jgi:hypothetical protein
MAHLARIVTGPPFRQIENSSYTHPGDSGSPLLHRCRPRNHDRFVEESSLHLVLRRVVRVLERLQEQQNLFVHYFGVGNIDRVSPAFHLHES